MSSTPGMSSNTVYYPVYVYYPEQLHRMEGFIGNIFHLQQKIFEEIKRINESISNLTQRVSVLETSVSGAITEMRAATEHVWVPSKRDPPPGMYG